MIHYSCDRCKRQIDSEVEFRFIVRLEVRAALDLGCENDDEADRDHLLELHEILEAAEEFDSDDADEDLYRQLRYDLCPECYRKFIKDPVGQGQRLVEFTFSEN